MTACACYVACKINASNPASPITPTGSYYPVSPGISWYYATFATDANGVKIPGSEGTETDTIIGTDTIGGRAVFLLQALINDTAAPIQYISFDSNGSPQYFVDTTYGNDSGVWNTIVVLNAPTAGVPYSVIHTVLGRIAIDSVYAIVTSFDTITETYNGKTAYTDMRALSLRGNSPIPRASPRCW